MTIPREVWYLPRPRRKNKYRGGFPAHFEKKLFELYGNPRRILQPFGGVAEYGFRVDINGKAYPDVVADAHNLPFRDGTFDFVLCDPPYSDSFSERLYKTPSLNTRKWIAESVRVAKVGGYVALYHILLMSRPKPTRSDRIIVIITRPNHLARICRIFQKVTDG